jgi:hypothetical protein
MDVWGTKVLHIFVAFLAFSSDNFNRFQVLSLVLIRAFTTFPYSSDIRLRHDTSLSVSVLFNV